MTSSTPHLSVVIPAYNEAHRIETTLRTILTFLGRQGWSSELIVVDDGSTDMTARVVSAVGAPSLRLVRMENNRGKGAALRVGVAESQGQVVQLWDADLSYDLDEIHVALAKIEAGANLVLGARDLAPSDSRERYSPLRQLASVVFNGLVETLLRLGVPDTQCGFKTIQGSVARELFPRLTLDRFSYDIELIAVARCWGLSIERIPVEMTVAAGSSIRVARDGPRMAMDILRVARRVRQGEYEP